MKEPCLQHLPKGIYIIGGKKWQDKCRNGEENLILQIDLSNIYQPITAKYLLLGIAKLLHTSYLCSK